VTALLWAVAGLLAWLVVIALPVGLAVGAVLAERERQVPGE
jgi:hypothetical protein